MKLFKKKDNPNWYCWFWIGSGRQKKRIKRCTNTAERRTAELVAAKLERQAVEEAEYPEKHLQATATMSQALDLLLRDRAGRVRAGKASPGTVSCYGSKRKILEAALGSSCLLRDLSSSVIDSFIEGRRRLGRKETTIFKEVVTLRCALRLAKRAGMWAGEVERIFPLGFSSGYKPKSRFLSHEELFGLLAELIPDRAALVAFIVATGARLSEAHRTRWVDVDQVHWHVHLPGTKTEGARRTVPIVTKWQFNLLAHALRHAEGQDGLLFTPWLDGNRFRDLNAACKAAGISPCSPNDLRRTTAQWMRRDAVPLELVSPIMGHRTTRMVELVYGRLSAQTLQCRLASVLGASELREGLDVDPPGASAAGNVRRGLGLVAGDRGTLKGHGQHPEQKPVDTSAGESWDNGLARSRNNSENPRVGGSIPSLGTNKSLDFLPNPRRPHHSKKPQT